MPRRIWVRIAIVSVVVLGSLWYLYPPKKTINLGLDLQGGIHLVLGVETDKAVASQTDRAAEDLKAALERKGIGVTRIAREGSATITVQLASPKNWNDALTATNELGRFQRSDENAAAGTFKLVLTDAEVKRLSDLAVRQGVETIRNRVDQFGVAEPTITRQGQDRILIQLPGVQDPERAKALIGKTALLEFKLLDERTSVEDAQSGRLPEGSELLYQRRIDKQTKVERKVPYVVQKRTLLTGAELNSAEVQADPNSPGNWQVAIEFNPVGTRIFGEITEQNVGKHLAIILDGNVYSAPRINERIPGGRAVITGQFAIEEARDLAIVLRAGALPAPVVVLEATLTLPGLAGIALTVGMAVDTNILIFERIREELKLGKTPRSAIEAGFTRALRTIIDTHLTVMVTAAILYNFGTGSVKGFAVSLFVGLAASLFTAYFFTRLLFDLVFVRRRTLQAISI